jgi:RNA recognition motif-containing protein
LPSTVTEQDIHEFFQPAGRIRDVKLMRDRFTGKSKGYGHVEFFDEGSIYPAIALNARPLRGFPVMIKTSGKVYSNMITHDRCGQSTCTNSTTNSQSRYHQSVRW